MLRPPGNELIYEEMVCRGKTHSCSHNSSSVSPWFFQYVYSRSMCQGGLRIACRMTHVHVAERAGRALRREQAGNVGIGARGVTILGV
jgi:hypothetical protein